MIILHIDLFKRFSGLRTLKGLSLRPSYLPDQVRPTDDPVYCQGHMNDK